MINLKVKLIALYITMGLASGFVSGFFTGSTVAAPHVTRGVLHINNRFDMDKVMPDPTQVIRGDELNPQLVGTICKEYVPNRKVGFIVFDCWAPGAGK